MKYILTIIDRRTSIVHNLERNEDTIDDTVLKELRGWGNLHSVCTSGINSTQPFRKGEYFMAGATKDDDKVFSILCIKDSNN